ncbi:Mus38-like protein [Penicillium malachiteum]|uniref:Mus38-like protein n=1 Tax=Penicillium malachiteum TaxID=1324776 RepID=A0AAD6HWD6_9EURO|nr:Mus38-like protein [Penicillium malachiteum]
MSDIDWVNLSQYPFFDKRKHPSAAQCDDIARSITGAMQASPVDTLSTLTYCVICNQCPSEETWIVVFREKNLKAKPLDQIVRLANDAFGPLALQPIYHGDVENANPPLSIYTTPCRPGISLLSTLRCQVYLRREQKEEHIYFIQDLARYFALSWENPQPMNPKELLYLRQAGIRYQLRQFKEVTPSILPSEMIDELIELLPQLFSTEYPSVLTNGNLSLTNIRIDEETRQITSIVDWSLAKILPFGMDLDVLFLVTGYMGLTEWKDYNCKTALVDCFWDEFFACLPRTVLARDVSLEDIRFLAEQAAKLGAILRYGFNRRADGSSDGEVSISEREIVQLRAWFGV